VHILRSFVGDIDGLEAFVGAVAENAASQGVVLDINPIWLHAYQRSKAGLSPEYFYPEGGWMLTPWVGGDYIDLSWNAGAPWIRATTAAVRGRPVSDDWLPFVVKAIAKPATAGLVEHRSRLLNLVRAQNFFATVETRPLGSLSNLPGDACSAGSGNGTIGGFLRDNNARKTYAATCGHVVSNGVNVSVGGRHIGLCAYSHAPRLLASGQLCTRNCGWANKWDFALIDIANASSSNVVRAIAHTIVPHQAIVLRGGVSKTNTFEVGGLLITCTPGNSNVCFENMFEVRPPTAGGIINPRLTAAISALPTQGDSGAWVETQGKEWCGVLVAADHLMGYALEAADTLSEANNAFGTQLTL
jgi:hypothetical protein